MERHEIKRLDTNINNMHLERQRFSFGVVGLLLFSILLVGVRDIENELYYHI